MIIIVPSGIQSHRLNYEAAALTTQPLMGGFFYDSYVWSEGALKKQFIYEL